MKNRDRIYLLATNDLHGDQRMNRVCMALSKQGKKVTLLGRIHPDSPPSEHPDYQTHRIMCLFNKGPIFYLEINLRFFLYLFFKKMDILYTADADTALTAIWLRWFKKFIWIFDAHEWFSEVPELEGKKSKKAIWKRIEKKASNKSNLRLTVSNSLATELENQTGQPFEVIRNVPACTNRGHHSRHNLPVVIYQGALNKGRGLECLLEAIAMTEELQCWIIGEGDLSNELRQSVRHGRLEDKVTFYGRLSPERMKEITPMAWMGYNLLESGSLSYYHSLSNKFFDYMHAGVPSINPPFPEYQKILSEYEVGCVLEELNPLALAYLFKQLIEQEDQLNLYRKNCAKAASEFTWEREEQKLIELIKHY